MFALSRRIDRIPVCLLRVGQLGIYVRMDRDRDGRCIGRILHQILKRFERKQRAVLQIDIIS